MVLSVEVNWKQLINKININNELNKDEFYLIAYKCTLLM